ncbi:serine hydrolase domain-containing protein [Sinomicrobium sp.]
MKIFKKILKGLLCTAALCVFQTAVNAQSIEEHLQKEMEEYHAVNLAVAVVKDNEIIYTNSFGWKDKEKEIPLEKDDLFVIASMSKSFAATAVMQLVEQGKLSLDDDVSDLLGIPFRNPKFPDIPITVKMLLTHTSSLVVTSVFKGLDIINPETNPDWAKGFGKYAPGTKYYYSNLGYNTMGAIIEKVSGERFDKYVKKHILDLLGLYGGYLPDELDATRFAQFYRYNSKTKTHKKAKAAYRSLKPKFENYKMGYSASTLSPTANMKLSVSDLTKYMMMHMNYGNLDGVQIISEESAKQMQYPHARMDSLRHYGFALRHDKIIVPGVEVVGHSGTLYGFQGAFMFDPEKKFGMVMLASGFEGSNPDFRSRITTVLYDHFIGHTPAQAPSAKKARVNEFTLILGAHGAKATKGNFADLKKEEVMTLKEASAHQQQTDLLYAYGKTTAANLMLPSSESVRLFGKKLRENLYEDWYHKNFGSLMALEGSEENNKLFKKVKTNLDLRKAYAQTLKDVKNREGYRRVKHGPNSRIYGLQEGDIVFMLVNSRDNGILSITSPESQEILAVGRVVNLKEGFGGEITIDFKTAVEP